MKYRLFDICMVKSERLLLGIFVASLLVGSCTGKTDALNDNSDWKQRVETELKKRLGKKMILPKNLTIVPGDTTCISERSPLKLVTFIDGSCSACIGNLRYWAEFIRKTRKNKLDCSFHIYIRTNLNSDFEKILDDTGFHYSWIQDEQEVLVTVNDIHDKRFETALLDKDSTTILFGDPIFREELADLYWRVIKERSSVSPN